MAHRAVLTAVVLVVAVLAAVAEPDGAAKKHSKDEDLNWKMLHHSFVKTLTYDDTLGDWLSSAASMALRDRVQVLPPVPNRYGLLWNKQALVTRAFEVKFTLSGVASAAGPKDGVLAFWVSPENFAASFNEQAVVTKSKDWLEGLTSAGFTFLQNRPNFLGLGVIFMGVDRQKAERQSVTAMWNDGKRSVAIEDIVEGTGVQTKFVDWMTGATQVRIRVLSDGSVKGAMMLLDVAALVSDTTWAYHQDSENISAYVSFLKDGRVRINDGKLDGAWKVLVGGSMKVEVPGLPSGVMRFTGALTAVQEEPPVARGPKLTFVGPLHPTGKEKEAEEKDHWVELFTLPPGTIPADVKESFIGFSGWTGSESSTEVNLHSFETLNFDAHAIGEQDGDILGDDSAEWLKVLEEEKRYLDQASQTEAVARLTKLLTDHVEKYDQLGEKLKGDLVSMETRLENLGADINEYLGLTRAWVSDSESLDPKVVRDHIVGIRAVLTKDKAAHDATLDSVSEAAATLKAKHGAAKLTDEGRAKVQAVSDLSQTVEDLAERGSVQTNTIFLVMVIAVAGLGLLFLNRMRYYEKKHYI